MRNTNQLIGILALGLTLLLGLRWGDHFPISNPRWIHSGPIKRWLAIRWNRRREVLTAPQCEEDAEERLSRVAAYLTTIDADFIAIEEVESAVMLHRLNVKLGGDTHEIFVQGTDDYTVCDSANNKPKSCVDVLIKDLNPELEGAELSHVAEAIPQPQRYTYWYDKNRNGVDDGAFDDRSHLRVKRNG